MATTSFQASKLALELSGQAAGWLRSCQPASVRVDVSQGASASDFAVRQGVRIALGEMAAEAELAESGPLLDWVAAVMTGDHALRSGAVVVADHNFNQRRRIGFTDARLTALSWPVLDATEAKRGFTMGLRWLAEAVDDGLASGKLKAAAGGKRKGLITSNYRLNGLPFGGEFVTRIELPALQVVWLDEHHGPSRRSLRSMAMLKLGELRLVVAAPQADAVRTWVRKLISDGQLDAGEALKLQVEMLDPALKKVMATIDLAGCELRGLDDSPLGNAEAVANVSLRFAVAGVALKLL